MIVPFLGLGRIRLDRGKGKRINTFTMWGMFLGIPNHFWQQIIATYGPDPLKSIWNFLATLAIDHICWKIPILYIFVTYVTYRQSSKNSTLADAWEESKRINPPIQKAAVLVWPTAQILNFLIIFDELTVLEVIKI